MGLCKPFLKLSKIRVSISVWFSFGWLLGCLGLLLIGFISPLSPVAFNNPLCLLPSFSVQNSIWSPFLPQPKQLKVFVFG